MNKSDLIEALQKETGLTKTKAADAVDLFFGEMTKALAKGDRIEIRGFCSIFVRDYKGGSYGFISSHACNYFGVAVFYSVLFARNLRFFTLISLVCAFLISYTWEPSSLTRMT